MATRGITNADGRLDRSLPLTRYQVPARIEVVGERLLWAWPSALEDEDPRWVSPSDTLLEEFVRLRDARPEDILRYAQQWGVLGICEHDLPASHNPLPVGVWLGPAMACGPRYADDRTNYEPLSAWLRFARQAHAMLTIAANLNQGEPAKYEEWQDAYGETDPPVPRWSPNAKVADILTAERLYLTDRVDYWLRLGNVVPILRWSADNPPLVSLGHPGPHGLFAALAMRLLAAISGTESLAVCTSCGAPFQPKRRARAEQRHYCPVCRESGAPQRDAARDYRQRQRVGRAGVA